MSLVLSPEIPAARSAVPIGSVEWGRRVNRLVRGQLPGAPVTRPALARTDVLLEVVQSAAAAGGLSEPVRFSGTAAEALVRLGLKATLLAELADAGGLDARHLYEFTGIDRSTVSRRSARVDVLPQEVAVKALEFAGLVATAADVFGTVADATRWLTRPHPALDGETPLRRARTPWGLERVRSMLGALKHGAPV